MQKFCKKKLDSKLVHLIIVKVFFFSSATLIFLTFFFAFFGHRSLTNHTTPTLTIYEIGFLNNVDVKVFIQNIMKIVHS